MRRQPGRQPWTSRPIERAVPAMIRFAASWSAAFKSAILVRAISSTCAEVTYPTLARFGSPAPLSMPAAFLSRIAAGGVLVMKV
jgi:hypothetical protein